MHNANIHIPFFLLIPLQTNHYFHRLYSLYVGSRSILFKFLFFYFKFDGFSTPFFFYNPHYNISRVLVCVTVFVSCLCVFFYLSLLSTLSLSLSRSRSHYPVCVYLSQYIFRGLFFCCALFFFSSSCIMWGEEEGDVCTNFKIWM
ncbi:hypothetical protein BDN70DRAFT_509142 [Pholiota conissans]|uniref:Uncharacterized protein n=1 Tax=Pholiota conissans TaxID=109636 RepID=A0A9P5YMU1_9AGAR|nr:hypothetical protein BDN70DRAFT_509142 [Pholiota conissans]